MNIKKLVRLLKKQELTDKNLLHLTANENQLSNTARNVLLSPLADRYFFGGGDKGIKQQGEFYLHGLGEVELIVKAAESALKNMTHANVVNLNCLSGVHAMMSAIISTSNPGDLVMSVSHEDGGHFATANIITSVGRKHIYLPFNKDLPKVNITMLKNTVKLYPVKVVYLDISYAIEPINLSEIRAVLPSHALIIYDASHPLGLILGKQYQDPFAEGADVICANTHKTLPGPQKGLVCFNETSLGERANIIIDGFLHSSTHTHGLLSLAITILEMKYYAEKYAKQIINNSNELGKSFDDLGYVTRRTSSQKYSENHQIHLFCDQFGISPKEIFKQLIKVGISTNIDCVLGDRHFIRLGTQEITRRGMKEQEMQELAVLIIKAIKGENVRDKVLNLNNRFRKVRYSFDR